ncbi:MAG TPA: VWA domain-containing protein [Terracidiphilus sp.]|nr:VWA domain-containing protein [Terracidiphilus sp.]
MRLMRIATLAALAGVVSAACGVAYGQPASGANRMSAAQNTPQPLVRSEAYTVLVDVVATKKGQAVLGLNRKQFHVFEDGHEQAIGFLEEHKPVTGSQVVERRALPPHTYNNIPSQPRGSAVNVLLLDALNTPLGNQVEVRRQMVKYVETIQPGTTMAIFTLSSRLRMIQGFTSNAGDLIAALKNASANPKQSTSLASPNGSAFDSAVGNLSMMQGAGAAVAAIENFQSANDSFQADMRATLTLEALQQLARYLSNVPGRKNLIWFSGSFPLDIGPTTVDNPAAGSRNYVNAIRSTAELLGAARVAVYPVSAEGLATLAKFDVANDGLGDGPHDADLSNRFTMETIAAQTGGLATFDNNGFAQAVASAVDNGSRYYTIGYVPADKNFHGQFRKLKVRVDDCGCELEYRSGYYADPPDKPSATGLPPESTMTTATLHGAPPSTQILFEVRVLPETDALMKDVHLPAKPIGAMAEKMKKPYTRYITDLAVDPRTLAFGTGNNGAREDSIEFELVGYDADGKRVNYVDRTAHLSLTASQYAQLAGSGLPARLALEMPAGRDFLLVAVHDLNSARVGSIEIPLIVTKE